MDQPTTAGKPHLKSAWGGGPHKKLTAPPVKLACLAWYVLLFGCRIYTDVADECVVVDNREQDAMARKFAETYASFSFFFFFFVVVSLDELLYVAD